MSKKNILFVINPIAGNGKQFNIDRTILEHLDHQKFNCEFVYTKHPGHASELSKSAVMNNMDIVVAVGGDGSVNEVARNLVHQSSVLGIIPMGSGNGLARHLKIPLDPVRAIKRINHCQHTLMDTATINNELFLNVAGLGFDAKISQKFATHGKRGFLTYTRLSLGSFVNYKPGQYHIGIDGNSMEKEAFIIAIANSSQYGNNAYIAPMAQTNDGQLDICIVKPLAFYSIPRFSYHLFNKSLHKTDYCEFYKGSNIVIQQEADVAHYDGEPFNSGKQLKINILASSLKVLT